MNTNEIHKGHDREKSLDKSVYFSDHYFGFRQLCSLVHQIYDIHKLRPRSILEVGIGNGFTSMFLRRAGYSVTTNDINAALEPDICCPLSELSSRLSGQSFDLVVCCEVLEHMPLDQVSTNIQILRSFSSRLYLTLPNHWHVVGLSLLPPIPTSLFPEPIALHFETTLKRPLQEMHYWEVGSEAKSTRKCIEQVLRRHYSSVSSRRYALNPWHIAFNADSA